MKLFEVSVLPVGANPDTEVIAVRAAASSLAMQAKAGRTFSTKNEDTVRAVVSDLREAADSLEAMLPASNEEAGASDDSDNEDDQDKASAEGSVESKSSASPEASVDAWTAQLNIMRLNGDH